MKPLLAHIFSPKRLINVETIYVQPKLNGVRALYQDGHFQSRWEQPWNDIVLRHLSDVLRQYVLPSMVLDGELYVHGWPFQRINGAVALNRHEPNSDTTLIEYHVFDVVDFHLPFKERLEQVKVNDRQLRVVETHKLLHRDLANDYYHKFVSAGYEGMMYRLGDCSYTWPKKLGMPFNGAKPRPLSDKDNRCWHLLKRKDWQDDEFDCIAVEEGEGKRKNMVGAFICRCGEHFFRVGIGFTEAQAIYYFENPPMDRKLKVKYLVLSRDGIPLNPSLIAVL
jgi:ATP-dependent DNA ligase